MNNSCYTLSSIIATATRGQGARIVPKSVSTHHGHHSTQTMICPASSNGIATPMFPSILTLAAPSILPSRSFIDETRRAYRRAFGCKVFLGTATRRHQGGPRAEHVIRCCRGRRKKVSPMHDLQLSLGARMLLIWSGHPMAFLYRHGKVHITYVMYDAFIHSAFRLARKARASTCPCLIYIAERLMLPLTTDVRYAISNSKICSVLSCW